MQKNRSSRSGAFNPRVFLAFILFSIGVSLAIAATGIKLVPGTAVLLSNTSGGGNGGNTSSTTSSTNIFSPSVFVDYKRFGGEPTVTVDRYPFTTGQTYRDITYVSGPNGFVFPHYSPFFKSDDIGQTFRIPAHVPSFGQTFGTGGGGGDSYQVVGQRTHKVFFVDLPGPGCVTMNTSTDQGETWVGDNIGCGQSPGAIDDRQWDAVDESAPLPAGNTGNVYVSFINFTNAIAPTLALARSTHDGAIGTFITSGPPYSLWVAESTDGGSTWTRNQVAFLGDHNPVNLFPQMAVDKAGNLYYTWSQTQGPASDASGLTGEQDVYYAFSTVAQGGATWSPPIPLTQEKNDSAVMPWMVAGDAGRVDIVYYKANSGLNSNVGFDASGNPMVWNVYFGQSLNALNTGSNFKSVQISDHPNHLGGICTAGLSCSGDRDLLDFFTVDIDHLGAANVVWADDNTTRGSDTRNKFSRQLSGVSVFKNTTINLMNAWPITDHSVTDRAADTFNELGAPNAACPGMDILGVSANRNGDLITISLTLDSAPSSAKAIACSNAPGLVTGGIWSAEFWAASDGNPEGYGESFYIGYRDNVPDGSPTGEAGRIDNVNPTITSLEYHRTQAAAVTGTCFATPAPTGPCTVTLTTSASTLGIKSGTGMYSITGLSTFFGGSDQTTPVLFRLEEGNSEQADAAAPFDVTGTGTTK
ncbi:MAG: hypothetical protein DME40_02535 [Verrucomicrobia bacterium]|nr:MAG: hypothetical protein DME40_02535 [Verrucomicrobiota bacterium]